MSTATDTSHVPDTEPLELLPWNTLAQILSTVKHAASKDETRYNLNGIYLEHENDTLVATATDGHRLVQARCPVPKDALVDFPAKGFLLTLPDAERLIGEAKRYHKLEKRIPYCVRLVGRPDGKLRVDTLRLETLEDAFEVKPIDGEFPNYQQVIGAHAPVAAFNGRYMAEAFKVLGDVVERSRAVKLSMPTGEDIKPECSPWRLDATSPDGLEVMAIVMPMKL